MSRDTPFRCPEPAHCPRYKVQKRRSGAVFGENRRPPLMLLRGGMSAGCQQSLPWRGRPMVPHTSAVRRFQPNVSAAAKRCEQLGGPGRGCRRPALSSTRSVDNQEDIPPRPGLYLRFTGTIPSGGVSVCLACFSARFSLMDFPDWRCTKSLVNPSSQAHADGRATCSQQAPEGRRTTRSGECG